MVVCVVIRDTGFSETKKWFTVHSHRLNEFVFAKDKLQDVNPLYVVFYIAWLGFNIYTDQCVNIQSDAAVPLVNANKNSVNGPLKYILHRTKSD